MVFWWYWSPTLHKWIARDPHEAAAYSGAGFRVRLATRDDIDQLQFPWRD